jgi:hypothetical protein
MEQEADGQCKLCDGKATKKCSNCDTKYCSRECQVKDWPVHKQKCIVFKLYFQIVELFRKEPFYNELLREHATRVVRGFPENSRKLVEFNFPNIESMKLMTDIEKMKRGAASPVEIMLGDPNRCIDTYLNAVTESARTYDVAKEAALLFRVPVENGFFVQTFVVDFLLIK